MRQFLLLFLLPAACAAQRTSFRPLPSTSGLAEQSRAIDVRTPASIAQMVVEIVESPPCAPNQQRTTRHELCMPNERDDTGCVNEPLWVSLTFCAAALRRVYMSGMGFGANGSRELYFDDLGRLRVVADEAHGSLWRNEYFSYASDSTVCTIGGADEWDEETMDEPDPPLLERLESRGGCDAAPAWPPLPYGIWDVPPFDPASDVFDPNSVAEDISLVRYLLTSSK